MSANSNTPGRIPDLAERLVEAAFGPDATITEFDDVGQGRGVFSHVVRLRINARGAPTAVVAKLPVDGPNGQAAIASGAAERELIAYERLLPIEGLHTPVAHATLRLDDGSAALLLDDLTPLRRVDQLDGLNAADTLAVVNGLATLHRHFEHTPPPDIRSNTPATFAPAALQAGLVALHDRWSIDAAQIEVFSTLVERRTELLDRFVALPATLCHGDPRADNLVFDDTGAVVLFDWQQLAVQAGEADLAWLLATSLDPVTRRSVIEAATRRYAQRRGQDETETAEALRTAFLLPGLAVLFLAQRASDSPRTDAFIRTSIERIADAVSDLASTVR